VRREPFGNGRGTPAGPAWKRPLTGARNNGSTLPQPPSRTLIDVPHEGPSREELP